VLMHHTHCDVGRMFSHLEDTCQSCVFLESKSEIYGPELLSMVLYVLDTLLLYTISNHATLLLTEDVFEEVDNFFIAAAAVFRC
jgi:hypothetical protein